MICKGLSLWLIALVAGFGRNGSLGFTISAPSQSVSRLRSLSFQTRLYSSEESTETDERATDLIQPNEIQTTNNESSVGLIEDRPTRQPSDLTTRQMMSMMNTSPRRIVLSSLFSTSIALSANFLGMTSKLLGAVPESVVEASGLDTFYPRGDFKRVGGQGYTFVIPKEWVADTAVELAKISRRAKRLDYDMTKRRDSVVPDAAFGPPGRLDGRGVSQGDTNVSVVLANLLPGFTLRGTLGDPNVAAETLLRVSLAPEGSGRTAQLIGAIDDSERRVYQFEYTIDRGERGVPLRAISLIAKLNNDTLLTLTVVAPQADWCGSDEEKFRKVASSFHLI